MDIYACFELNGVDAPILRALKTYANAMAWRGADLTSRYFVLFAVDAEPETFPPETLFEWAAQRVET